MSAGDGQGRVVISGAASFHSEGRHSLAGHLEPMKIKVRNLSLRGGDSRRGNLAFARSRANVRLLRAVREGPRNDSQDGERPFSWRNSQPSGALPANDKTRRSSLRRGYCRRSNLGYNVSGSYGCVVFGAVVRDCLPRRLYEPRRRLTAVSQRRSWLRPRPIASRPGGFDPVYLSWMARFFTFVQNDKVMRSE
jgi:hypothetical protein